MEDRTGNTFKIRRETHQVSQRVRDNLKSFNAIKKRIIEAFGNEELTIPQLAEKTGLNREDTTYYTMSLLKFGLIQTVRLDDADEFYFYKIRE